ncbi:hypothetical protein [Varunaivibrio sulfuroxidans]|uniref:Uncharacterized protein n=1 Tax=Varunaivibrio sulfuroxidans TaxID=1773489 RepID=A0A4R3J8S3_9PROT|nr:hypothetical protein [Varunaivibrio sulfuroxidans]TCS61336.1 hypothetical protein EDD55_108136 [Varunaivibrio sulfuroxidans]WES31051.1 hypothetical protein P3M64_01340 [Varunaivibrio sulfuroxidans]
MARNLVLSVHEFMTIMGTLDEAITAAGGESASSVYDAWYMQWREVDEKLESLSLMKRADMLFDGKITINNISDAHLNELMVVVENQIRANRELLDSNDEDADEEELEMWEKRLENILELRREGEHGGVS